MLRILFFLVFLFYSSGLRAQSPKADSIINLIKTDKEDTIKVNHLNLLDVYFWKVPGKDTIYAMQALAIAKKINYYKGVGVAYWHLGWANWSVEKNYVKALYYFFKADSIYVKYGRLDAHMNALFGISNVYYGVDSFNNALKYGFMAMKLNEKVKDPNAQASLPENIGTYYMDLGDYPNALKYYMDALKVIETAKDSSRIGSYLEDIGDLYCKMGDYNNAIKYLDSALTKSQNKSNKRKWLQKLILLDIGSTYKAEKKYPEALDYTLRALQLCKKEKTLVDESSCLEVVGEIYKEQGDYSKALDYEMEALKAAEEAKYKPVIIQSQGVVGEIYLKQEKYSEAEKYLRMAITSVRGTHEMEPEKNYALDLSLLYSATNQFKKSLEYYAKYDSIKDVLFNRDKSREIGRVEAKAEYDRQLASQQAEENKAKEIAEAKSRHQQIINLLVILIAVVITLIAIIIYRSWRAAKKEKNVIEREKILMELKALRAQMNPHFIFNAINSIQNFILDNDQDSAQRHLNRFSKLIRMVLENSSYENIPLADEIKMLELYLEFETVRFSSKFSYKIIVDSNIDPSNTFISPLIIQPYLENAIWHGLMHLKERSGEVVIQFKIEDNQLKCIIDDNGIGRERSLELKKGSVHKSMGLSITSERLEIMNALFKSKMSVNFTDKISKEGTAAGTKVELLMPAILNSKIHA